MGLGNGVKKTKMESDGGDGDCRSRVGGGGKGWLV